MAKKLKNPTQAQIDEALKALNFQVKQNQVEFPDAAWNVCCRFEIQYEILVDAYDAQYA